MDLSEDEVESLFGDDRGTDIDDVYLSHWLTIERDGDGVTIETDDGTYHLDTDEKEQMLDDLGWDSIWRAISERTKCLRYLRSHDEREN